VGGSQRAVRGGDREAVALPVYIRDPHMGSTCMNGILKARQRQCVKQSSQYSSEKTRLSLVIDALSGGIPGLDYVHPPFHASLPPRTPSFRLSYSIKAPPLSPHRTHGQPPRSRRTKCKVESSPMS
jgi:hypothetical protein